MPPRVRAAAPVVIGLIPLFSLAGAGPAHAGDSSEPLQLGAARVTTGKALLGKLTVRAEHRGGYQRSKFKHWIDVDNDCQDTRSEVLQRESQVKVAFYSARQCAVLTGRWTSSYDGLVVTQADQLEVDHVVALSEAWKSGGSTWKKARRTRYANDLGFAWTLEPVTRKSNQDKVDQDPAEWLPAQGRCAYARHWVAIKYRWRLSIDTAEKRALSGLLSGDCGLLKLKVPARAQ
ncbi:HNH endonuclease family protein [Kineosporia mesophila]|uniref:HNH endonuclease family protein n=1 Tax=Kineosporia mesophila TaxID=566012 RepID=A0ABP7ABZ9_9ACTN|nr:HNH endonuclease family protein [Kineosporia mesophila]MCD5351313.1 HNH endonuclease family protein [Kineosporia mesophila]